MQFEHWLRPELAASPLVGLGRVGEAVAQYNLALRQRRRDDLVNMLRPRSEHERHLRIWRQAGRCRMQDYIANLFASQRAAGLTRDHDRDAASAERFGQFFDLRAFAGAVEAFEGDELSAMGLGHEKDDTAVSSQLSAFGDGF